MLRKLFSILLVLLVTAGLFIQDADARRFGGGRSFGISRSTSSFTRTSPMGQRQAYGQTTSSASRWMGPLAGLAAGGLLASLFMNHGVGSGILSLLLAGGLILVALSFLRNRMQPKHAYRQDYRPHYAQDNMAAFAARQDRPYSSSANNIYPIGFDTPTFLREAKASFIRLQAAYDQKNLNDIREFTTPEVFAEIQLQFQERGIVENKTDVISLEAELLGVDSQSQSISGTEMQTMVASVRFNGVIQEDRHLPAENVSEVWHFKREIGSLRWIVAGVQQ